MAATDKAKLSFLPWVRQGAAAAITAPDARTATQAAFTSVGITLKINNESVPNLVSVRLRGPADVTGIDAHQVLRTDPLAGTNDFESNCFPSIEFDRADFPWLFTPAAANGESQLRPWLCLIVVRKQAGVSVKSAGPTPLPMLEITNPASPAAELPDPMESWAWAHAQVAADISSSDPKIRAASVTSAIDGPSELSLSRLIAPRALAANTDYIACVVPTFEVGRKTGLGSPTADSDPLTPAWSNPPPATVQLPVYYSWEFRTGEGGNFKSLATNLTSDVPNGLGQRPVSIAAPGFTWTPDTTTAPQVMLEGALQPLVANPARPVLWADKNAPKFEGPLAEILNQAGRTQTATPGSDPLLAPPLYGRWHAARNLVNVGGSVWFDELNLDPRWRSAAALGTRVVQQHQEALMASAWEQAAEAQVANQRLRQLQLSMAIGDSLHRRHLKSIAERATAQGGNEEMLLRFAAPAFSRLRFAAPGIPAGSTVAAQVVASRLPIPATSSAMRRVGRHRGPYSRRIAAQGFTRPADQAWVAFSRPADQSWVARLNYGTGNTRPAVAPTVAALISALPTPQALANAQWNTSFRVLAENQPPALTAVTLLPPDWDYPGRFRAAAFAHLSKIRPAPTVAAVAKPALAATAPTVLDTMRPRNAHAKLARAIVTTASNVLAPNGTGAIAVGGETAMFVPSFQQPMYEPLQELSSNLLLPGLETVKPETVLGLKTNRAFMEAYMVGLNFEMGRELLWRDFPTDQRGTYFKNFWGYDAAAPASGGSVDQWDPDDIDDLHKWGTRALGVGAAGTATDQFVLLLRSALLRRYPNALIYLTPVLINGEPSDQDSSYKMPIFNGSSPPDVSFFGFPISAATAIGNSPTTGYFVIFQEHPTESRFGLDANIVPGNTPYFSATKPPPGVPSTWGKNAALMASITRRSPMRIAIRASQLIAH